MFTSLHLIWTFSTNPPLSFRLPFLRDVLLFSELVMFPCFSFEAPYTKMCASTAGSFWFCHKTLKIL